MTQDEIQDLIKFVAKSGVHEVEIERKDFKITIKSSGVAPKRGKAAAAAAAAAAMEPQAVHVAVPSMPMPMQMPAAMPAPAPVATPAPAPAAPAAEPAAPAADANLIEIKSPMIGTFYRKPSPDKDTFVEVGSTVKPGDTVCVIEAMKLFNEIESEVSGRIVKILVDDNSPVEYDQPLFLVEPA